ncbi:hypothetical protein FKM82_024001 [Ascaphus truei]
MNIYLLFFRIDVIPLYPIFNIALSLSGNIFITSFCDEQGIFQECKDFFEADRPISGYHLWPLKLYIFPWDISDRPQGRSFL